MFSLYEIAGWATEMDKIYYLIGGVLIIIVVMISCRAFRVFLQRYEKVLALLFAVFGGMYVLIEYWNTQDEGRLKQTLQYIQRVQSGDVADARRWFDIFWIDNADLVEKFNKMARDEAKRADAGEILRKLEEKALEDKNGKSNIVRMFYFYADLSACNNLGICDHETSCKMFIREIKNHDSFFRNFVQKWTNISFAGKMAEIEKFNKSCGKIGG